MDNNKNIITTDIAVIGGGPGGMATAISASRLGMDVVIVERQGFLGGNLATGLPLLGFLDAKGRQVTGGFAQELVDRLTDMGGCYGHRRCPFHNSTTVINPFYARIICAQLVKENKIKVLLHCEASSTQIENKQIKSITVSGKGQKITINAKVFVDATGDGDVAYMSGANYEKGQEKTGVLQPSTLMFDIGGIEFNTFFDYIENHKEELPYNSGLSHIREGYDAAFFRESPNHVFFGLNALLKKLEKEGKSPLQRDTLIYIRQPIEDHAVINSIRILNKDGSDIFDLSDSEIQGHLQIMPIIKMLNDYVPGFENCYLSSINASIGVRESRRITGKKTLTSDDVLSGNIPDDSICLGSYIIDIHDGNGGATYIKTIEEPYGIPYKTTISSDIEGLMLSGRCISVDAVAFGSTRVMPTCMAVGEAVGVGAALSIKNNCSPADVNVSDIRNILIENGAILHI